MNPKRIILASGSPRRKEILEMAGFSPIIKKPNFDEEMINEKNPAKLVETLSEGKAKAIIEECEPGDMIITADTIVCLDKVILGKPKTKKQAFEMLRMLAGKKHYVYTGVTITYIKKNKTITKTFSEKTEVSIGDMTNCQIHKYIDSGEPMDKAGAYGIQGSFCKHVEGIKGDYYNVVGLPIYRVSETIRELSK